MFGCENNDDDDHKDSIINRSVREVSPVNGYKLCTSLCMSGAANICCFT